MSLYGLKYCHPDYFGTPGFWRWYRLMQKRQRIDRIIISISAMVLWLLFAVTMAIRFFGR